MTRQSVAGAHYYAGIPVCHLSIPAGSTGLAQWPSGLLVQYLVGVFIMLILFRYLGIMSIERAHNGRTPCALNSICPRRRDTRVLPLVLLEHSRGQTSSTCLTRDLCQQVHYPSVSLTGAWWCWRDMQHTCMLLCGCDRLLTLLSSTSVRVCQSERS